MDRADKDERRIRALEKTVRILSREEIEDKRRLRRLMARSFLGGIARGAGTLVGIALMGTVGVYILTKLAEQNMAGLGAFLAEIVKWVQREM